MTYAAQKYEIPEVATDTSSHYTTVNNNYIIVNNIFNDCILNLCRFCFFLEHPVYVILRTFLISQKACLKTQYTMRGEGGGGSKNFFELVYQRVFLSFYVYKVCNILTDELHKTLWLIALKIRLRSNLLRIKVTSNADHEYTAISIKVVLPKV